MIDFGILCALDKEYDLLYDRIKEKTEQSDTSFSGCIDGGQSICVLKCGIGKVNATLGAVKLIEKDVKTIFSIGVAGSADISIKRGDIVIGNAYCYHDFWCGLPNMPGQVQGLPAVFPSAFDKCVGVSDNEKVHFGTIATGDWFVQTKEHIDSIKEFLPKEYNVSAIDMESAAIAHVCYVYHIPFVSIRAISDNLYAPNQEVQYESFWDDMAKSSFDLLCNILNAYGKD